MLSSCVAGIKVQIEFHVFVCLVKSKMVIYPGGWGWDGYAGKWSKLRFEMGEDDDGDNQDMNDKDSDAKSSGNWQSKRDLGSERRREIKQMLQCHPL